MFQERGDRMAAVGQGHQLLRAWARYAGESPLPPAADPQSLLGLQPWLRNLVFKVN